jgi:integrase
MRPFFEALKAEPPHWRDFWLLALFTGARRGNVISMAWADLDLGQGISYLAGQQMKNGLPQVIVLPPPAVATLQARHEESSSADYVFPSESGGGHIIDPRKSWARVLKSAGVENLRPHDLRRSLGSWQAIAGASLQIIGQSLGHRDPEGNGGLRAASGGAGSPVRQRRGASDD